MAEKESFFILGVKINVLTLKKTVNIIDGWISKRHKDYVILTGAHGIVEMQKDGKLLGINNRAGLVTPDGMPEVWLGKLKGFKDIEKVYAPDIMLEVFKHGLDKNYSHYFYGGKEGVADKLIEQMKKRFPGIRISGSYCPPFRQLTDTEKDDVIKNINKSGADIVWCGLGCPKQEYWIDEFRGELNAPVLIGVGAGFDFLSGEKPLAPRWIVNSGFEWFYRIFSDPRRLIVRYAKIVPKFIILNFFEYIGLYKNNKLSFRNL